MPVSKALAVAGQVDANNVTTPPTIDGNLNEAGWNLATTANKTTIGAPNNTVTFGAMWDATNLYIGVKVLDANLFNDSANTWEDDSVEVYIDANHNHGTTYDSFDRQFVKGYNDTSLSSIGSATGVVHAWAAIAGGYNVELAIPWSNLGITPTAGMMIGLDVGNNDDDNAGTRESQAVWWGTVNDYNNTSGFGNLNLLPAAGATATQTPTRTLTPGPTSTFTITPTRTFTPVGPTSTFTSTPTRTFTVVGPTLTFTPTATRTFTPTVTFTPASGQSAYPSGVAWAIPGTIQAENFDLGGETVAYHDAEAANQGGQYRTADGVDIEASTDTGGGYNVGWTQANEWVEYTVNVASAGNYTLMERVASGSATGQFRVEFNGLDKTGVITVPNTGGWQTWQNLNQTVSLSAGVQIMRVYFTGNDANLNYLTLSGGGPTNTPTNTVVGPTQTFTPTPTQTPVSVSNLALGKPIVANGTTGTFVATNANDGNVTTYWEGAAYTNLLTVDLGSAQSISSVKVKLNPDPIWAARTQTLSILGSTDNVNFTTLSTSANYGFDPATGNQVTIAFTAATTRYVRLSMTANTGAPAGQAAEFEVYATNGGPTNTPTVTNTPGGVNHQPNTPTITEPNIEGKVVNPGDVHMETAPFSDPDAGQIHACTDWEIWTAGLTERVWFTSCIGGIEKVHTHLGDGVFQGSLAGRTDLLPNTDYIIRVRHKDNSGAPATEWSAYAQRGIHTSDVSIGNPNQLWSLPQAGYEVQVAATGFQLPVNIAFVPNPGTLPTSPFYYVVELYGNIKVVTRAGAISDYVTGLLNFNPTGNFPGTGEQGVTGLVIDPVTGDLFAGMLYEAAGGNHYPKVVRFHSTNGGMTAATQTVILDMAGETQGQSHQISNLSLGPDGKLYVHMGDGFDATKGQDLTSFRGKILRMNLDGSAATDNPLYNAGDGITARDYVYAYGFRNPFGGAWRASDNAHYEVENGPSVDRFAKVVANRNYLYDGSDGSMSNFAIFNWNPSRAPVNIVFLQTQTFNGSGFPASKMDHAFVSESGPTYTTGPQTLGKRIVEFVLNASGNLVSGPTTILEYTGVGKASVVALTAGPDGLYFSDLYKDLNAVTPIDRGANIYRLKYIGP